jgi:hypothetical protein
MGRFIDLNLAIEDDPIFDGSWMVFSIHRPKPQTNTDTEEKPAEQLPENPEEPAP